MGAAPAMLRVDGEAAGSDHRIRAVPQPQSARVAHRTACGGAEAVGNGTLALKMGLPLGGPAR
jgi:hypothetical protein